MSWVCLDLDFRTVSKLYWVLDKRAWGAEACMVPCHSWGRSYFWTLSWACPGISIVSPYCCSLCEAEMLLPVLFTLKPFVFGPAGLPWLMCLQGKQSPTYGSRIQVCLVQADLERVENRQQSFHQVSEQQVFGLKREAEI